jgi:hypothetical protein
MSLMSNSETTHDKPLSTEEIANAGRHDDDQGYGDQAGDDRGFGQPGYGDQAEYADGTGARSLPDGDVDRDGTRPDLPADTVDGQYGDQARYGEANNAPNAQDSLDGATAGERNYAPGDEAQYGDERYGEANNAPNAQDSLDATTAGERTYARADTVYGEGGEGEAPRQDYAQADTVYGEGGEGDLQRQDDGVPVTGVPVADAAATDTAATGAPATHVPATSVPARDVQAADGQGAEAPVAGAPRNDAEAARPHAQLLADQELADIMAQWKEVQAQFVDEPRQAVADADALVAELMQRLAETFASERRELEERWSGGGEVSTEDLRQGLRRYRSFFERLLNA